MREDFINLLIQKVNETFGIMKPYMPAEEGLQRRVAESMNYSFISGGKRIRPLFMLESYRLFGGDDLSKISPFMAAIEMIHTYSLIHDDLPAMDNDDYRRGRPTNHKMFDEATAILAGDGLLNLAFETVANAMNKEEDIIILRRMAYANSVLAQKAGIYGMIGGQMVDLLMENKSDTDLDTILFIHKHKTAALIEASLMIGAIMAGACLCTCSDALTHTRMATHALPCPCVFVHTLTRCCPALQPSHILVCSHTSSHILK